jgi:hypothetical protein
MGLTSQGHGITEIVYVSKRVHVFIKAQSCTRHKCGMVKFDTGMAVFINAMFFFSLFCSSGAS